MGKTIFTQRVTEELVVPETDPVQTITIRKLAGRHLEKASQEAQRKALASVKAVGGPALLKEYLAIADRTTDDDKNKATDPMSGYDPYSLIADGVVAWTFEESRTEDVIADLDVEIVDWLARAVLKLARPRLFQSEAAAAAAQGNGSGPSTAP